MKKLLVIALMLILGTAWASQKRKVMIIGIDGTRSDALQQANTPVIDSLIANGTYSFSVYHMGITVSGPSWSDVLCGVWEAKHGVTNNDYTNSKYNTYPYFTTRAKTIQPNLFCSQVVEWPPLNDKVYNDSWNKKILTACDGCQDGRNNTSELACQELSDENLDCIFIYYDQVDITGHSSGFNPNNPSYIAAIEYVDSRLATVMQCLHNRTNYAAEDWLVLLVPDHGGTGTGHGGGTKQERNIWWIASGPAVPQQQIVAADPGTYNVLHQIVNGVAPANPAKIAVTPVQTDIAVTALHHLIADSVGTDTAVLRPYINQWKLDGKSWLKSFSTPTAIMQRTNELPIKYFPNPVQDKLTVWADIHADSPAIYSIRDVTGRVVQEGSNILSYKLNIDCSTFPAGTYIIQVQTPDGRTGMQKFIKQ